ncbi:MAG: aminoacyl-tRNA deacylase [Bradyrhizobium sp.]
MSIQVAILKVLASHGSGRATTESLKQDIALLATSGPEWNARMRRLAGRVHAVDIVASGYVTCDREGWQITDAGREFLYSLEAVTQDNRLQAIEHTKPDEPEEMARPDANLIVIDQRLKMVRR